MFKYHLEFFNAANKNDLLSLRVMQGADHALEEFAASVKTFEDLLKVVEEEGVEEHHLKYLPDEIVLTRRDYGTSTFSVMASWKRPTKNRDLAYREKWQGIYDRDEQDLY